MTVSCDGTDAGLRLRWQETRGPPVAPRSRTGFGTKLIQAIADHSLGGHAKLEYPPDGFRCEVLLLLERSD